MRTREVRELQGKAITSLDELLKHDRVIFNGQLVPITWCYGWSLKQTKRNIDRRLVFAVKE